MEHRLYRQAFRNVPAGPPVSHAHEYRQKLNEFWERAKALPVNPSARLRLLKEFAAYRLSFKPKKPYDKRRVFAGLQGRAFPSCFACGSLDRPCRHHILQLQHGGPNVAHNVVRLCGACHEVIHPWLKD